MNTLVIVLIAAVVLFGAYVFYGRWLANKWGIDPKAKTPAVEFNDGKDFVPTNGWTVFSHQFSSIAGAAPCNRRNSGCGVRLAAGTAVGADRRRILRRGSRLRRAVRFG